MPGRNLPILLLLIVIISGTVASGQRPSRPSKLNNYFIGNTVRPSNQPIGGPGILVMGGAGETDSAFTSFAYPMANGGDFVILRTDQSSGYQDYLYTELVN